MNLREVPAGTALTVEHVGGDRSFRRRLMELGLVPGTRVDVIGVAPFGGPIELLARGCSLSVGREEAAHVVVKEAVVAPRPARDTTARALSAAVVVSNLNEP